MGFHRSTWQELSKGFKNSKGAARAGVVPISNEGDAEAAGSGHGCVSGEGNY